MSERVSAVRTRSYTGSVRSGQRPKDDSQVTAAKARPGASHVCSTGSDTELGVAGPTRLVQ